MHACIKFVLGMSARRSEFYFNFNFLTNKNLINVQEEVFLLFRFSNKLVSTKYHNSRERNATSRDLRCVRVCVRVCVRARACVCAQARVCVRVCARVCVC